MNRWMGWMRLARSLYAARRRWTLTGALLLLTVTGFAVALGNTPRTYQSESSVVLLASRGASKPNGGNPYLSFSPSLTLAADVLTRELMSPRTVKYLAFHGFRESYTVALATYTTQTTGSVLLVTVTGTDKAGVENTLQGVNTDIRTRLGRMQSRVSRYDRIRAVTLATTPRATLSVSQTARPLALVLCLGLAMSFGIPWLLDAQKAARGVPRAAMPAAPARYQADPAAAERWTLPQQAAPADPPRVSDGSSPRSPAQRGQISE